MRAMTPDGFEYGRRINTRAGADETADRVIIKKAVHGSPVDKFATRDMQVKTADNYMDKAYTSLLRDATRNTK